MDELEKLQSQIGLHCANKLRREHIKFQNAKMRVKLATQLFSKSVADSLDFLREDLKMPSFAGSAATSDFLRRMDKLFDWLNSRNPWAKGFKAGLRPGSHHFWTDFIVDMKKYLLELKDLQGNRMVNTPKKTGFVGFIVSMLSVVGLYNDLVLTGQLKFLLCYKLSQDHLELWFHSVRSGLGNNNNPSGREFIVIYKKLLVQHQVKGVTGNCIPLDDTVILQPKRRDKQIASIIDAQELSLWKQLDQNLEQAEEEEEDFDFDYVATLPGLNGQFKDCVINYICGFVIRMVMRGNKCPVCMESLHDRSDLDSPSHSLIRSKTNGGLFFPSKSLVALCTIIEKRMKVVEETKAYLSADSQFKQNVITSHVIREIISSKS